MANLTGQEGPDQPVPNPKHGNGKGHGPGDGSGRHNWGKIEVSEDQIATLVKVFYDSARADDFLAPIFARAISDWDAHLVIVQDFWSHVLLETSRYKGHPFPVHMQLPIQPEHFDRWLELFLVAADATLPDKAAARAKARAVHMVDSFRVGIFPFVGADGRPSRLPPKIQA